MMSETKYEELAEICQRIIERIMAEDEHEERARFVIVANM